MPWGRMDDKFHRNRKVRALRRDGAPGREALGVWVYWWSWCLDDPDQTGVVPRDDLSAADLKAAKLLVERELWEPCEDGFRYHDFDSYTVAGARAEAKREADRVRLAVKRAVNVADVARDTCDNSATVARDICDMPQADHATSATDPSDTCDTVAQVSQPRARAPRPVPSRPVPSRPEPEDEERATEPWLVVARAYQERYEREKRTPWMSHAKSRDDLSLLARWCAEVATREGRDLADVATQLLDNAFRDGWLTSHDWPIGAIAKAPGRLYAPPALGPRAPMTHATAAAQAAPLAPMSDEEWRRLMDADVSPKTLTQMDLERRVVPRRKSADV